MKRHHTTADWTFQANWWALDPAYFISPPTSLKLWKPTSAWAYRVVVLDPEISGVLKEGAITCYFRVDSFGYSSAVLYFRMQCVPPTVNQKDSYRVKFDSGVTRWHYVDADGNNHLRGSIICPFAADTWYRIKILWWEGKNPQNNDATILRLYLEEDGGWVQKGEDQYDTHRENVDSDHNNVGLGIYGIQSYGVWYDDTIIAEA